jgi:type IV pilus assembly protein PilE
MMIVVAIIGILAAIATPSYVDYLRRGAIPEGLAGLSEGKVKMEQYFMDNRGYSCAPINVTADPSGLLPGQGTPAGKFFVTCELVAATTTPPTPAGYRLTAAGKRIVAGFMYTVNNAKIKATVSTGGWGKDKPETGANPCWILKRDGSC